MRNNRAPTFRATGAVDRQVPIYDDASAGPELWSALLRNPLPRDVIAGIKTHALENLAVSREKPNFPVLLFSPGFGATPTEYTALLEDFASHGYVVVAINPTGFVPVTDGRSVYVPFWNISLYDPEKEYPVWVQDMLFVLNEVSREHKDPQSPLFDRLDMTRVGAFGHSLGEQHPLAHVILIRESGLD